MRGLAAGDRAAFETLYRQHNEAMVRVASAILHNHASAEEVAHETWISVLRNIDQFEGRSSLAGWIFTILSNTARTRAKRDGRAVALDIAANDDGLTDQFDPGGRWKQTPAPWADVWPDLRDEQTPERIVAGREVLAQVRAAVEALPPAQRAVLVLRAQQGLDAAEVCAILDISQANMRVLLHRARLSVRAKIDAAAGRQPG
ncbi:RNA polymerase sigma factor [Aquicoccus sp. G2-2]|uniref:RNA polymerase sigma factor n=1 Tax=Aquicoccus sp. G2-2 TaxID=3092120 RepID=UPI002AE03BE4|nr:sigma-70 family RNA polymerase sigma factor [Aquicoccus sp. G2-2]MEA1113492.1 sigma-70 family RNA polymerase sigma factor [Aquicoccus sp. G2-2]